MKRIIAAVLCLFILLGASASAEYDDSFVVRAKDAGPCRRLTGNVEILLVFVSTPQHPWTQKQKDAVNRVSFSSVDIMMDEAKDYGTYLNMCFGGLDFSIPYEYSKDLTWYYYILEHYFGASSIVDVYDSYRRSLNMDETPMIFLFNSWDRSHTYCSYADYSGWNEEFCVIFCDTKMHDNYLTHEVMHLYGAIDLYDYNNEGVQKIAEKYFPNSNMLAGNEIDELTAYLVGWEQSPSYLAQCFINETRGLR